MEGSCWIGFLLNLPAAIGTGLTAYGLESIGFALCLASLIMQLIFLCCVGAEGGQSDAEMGYNGCNSTIAFGILIYSIVQLAQAHTNHHGVNYLQVNQVDLTQFELNTTSGTLNYSLAVSLGPKDGNDGGEGMYYEELKAWGYYQGHNFTSLSTLSPGGDEKNGSYYNSTSGVIHLIFQGQHELALTGGGLKRYRKDAAAGRFTISMTLSYSGFKTRQPSAINDTTGHRKSTKGVVTFELKQVALATASTGWVEGDPIKRKMIGYIAGISVSAFLFLSILACFSCYAVKESTASCGLVCAALVCLLITLIPAAICVPYLVRALGKADKVKLAVSNPALTQFNLSSSSTLDYNLSMDITVGPNLKKTGVYYDKFEAAAYYQGQNLTSLALSPFYLQGRLRNGSRTVILRPVFQGQQVLTGGDKYQEETKATRYSIVVRLSYSGIRTNDYDYNSSSAGQRGQLNGVATFDLKVPLLDNVGGEALSSAAAAAAACNVCVFTTQHFVVVLAVVVVSLCF